MSTLEKAITIAAEAHTGQIDKAGQPYILHPLRVMLHMTRPEERIVAVLHDVIEDTTLTADDLRSEGFSTQIIEAILALTKTGHESRIDAAKRAALNPIARIVKIADVRDNMDLSRITYPKALDHERMNEYQEVLDYLQNHG